MKNAFLVEYLDGSTGIFIGDVAGQMTAHQNGIFFGVLRPATKEDVLAHL